MMAPYLRPASPEGIPSAPCPPGWRTAPAGVWRGAATEVAFDPDLHRVAFLRGPSETVTRALARAGFTRVAEDAESQMWVAGAPARRSALWPAAGRVSRHRAPRG